jgi:hypothetical protein
MDLARHCDTFVHVPHAAIQSPVTDAEIIDEDRSQRFSPPLLLSAPSLLSITLHHLTEQLGYEESSFQDHKYEVAQLHKQRDEQLAHRQRLMRLEARRESDRVVDELANDSVIESLFALEGREDY